jgi:hypothetical protein
VLGAALHKLLHCVAGLQRLSLIDRAAHFSVDSLADVLDRVVAAAETAPEAATPTAAPAVNNTTSGAVGRKGAKCAPAKEPPLQDVDEASTTTVWSAADVVYRCARITNNDW